MCKQLKANIQVNCFLDEEDRPTCAKSFEDPNEYCSFIRVGRFGTSTFCVFSEVGYNGQPLELDRYDKGYGRLIPCDNCKVWKLK